MSTELYSSTDYLMGEYGSALEPFSYLKDYRVHVLRNWRFSAESWDREICELLELPLPERKLKKELTPGFNDSAELWSHYFAFRRAEAGLTYEGGCIRKIRIADGAFPPLATTVMNAMATNKPNLTAYALVKPGRFFHRCRMFLGNILLYPTEAEFKECLAFAWAEKARYEEKYGKLSDVKSLSAHLFHSLPQILKGVSSVRDAINRMEPACAWTATVEGGPGTDWETVKRAIWRRIPIILEGKDGDWRTAFAYLVHNGKKLLLVTKRQDAASAPAEPVLRQVELPEELPPELEFIEYDETQWTPWFAHHFEPTVEHLAPRILEIFKNHPEAKAYRDGHISQ